MLKTTQENTMIMNTLISQENDKFFPLHTSYEYHKDEFVDNSFTIELLHGGCYKIDADNLQDAIDILVDYFTFKKQQFRGYFLSIEEQEEAESDGNIDEYLNGGNEGVYLSFQWHEVRYQELHQEKEDES